MGESDGVLHSLATIVVRSTKRPAERRVIAEDVPVELGAQALTWSPDGRYLAWYTNGLTDTGNLYAYDARSGDVRRVVAGRTGADSPAEPVPHFNAGRHTLAGYSGEPAPLWLDARTVVSRVFSGPAATRPELKWPAEIWSIDVPSGRVRKLAAIAHGTIWSILVRHASARAWVREGELMVWVHTDDHDDVLGAVDIRSGRYRSVTGGHFSFFFFSTMPMPTASPDGERALLVRQSASEPPDVWLQPVDGGAARQLTHLNAGRSFRGFGTTELLTYQGPDGRPLRAALKLPPGYVPGHPVPLVVNTYIASGWSFLANHFAFEGGADNPLLLTSRGYAVLLPDVPIEAGKTGGRAIAEAVLAGVDEAIRRGYADPRRLGITGHSYGGYAVYSAIVRTQRFRAAVVRSGFPDWIPVYLTMRSDGSSSWGIGNAEGARGPGGTLWERRDQFIENSPLFVFDRITTPVLIVHGTKDYLAEANAKMAFVALRRLGKDVTLALYDGEGHSQNEYSVPNQQDYVEREIAWFDRYLCPARTSPVSCTQ
jgi:dipeptidyl aminopeptidase/acylaminoacyl peptidase